MKTFHDVINFNADASCLTSEVWYDALAGGDNSLFCRWLDLYIHYNSKISLGLTGATAADLLFHNPEAIRRINEHPDIFQIITRPFSHDIALLRSEAGFSCNLEMGKEVLAHTFRNLAPFYLAPEFMFSGEQVYLIQQHGITHTFISSERFPDFQKQLIPAKPYTLRGILKSRLTCIPIHAPLTPAYLLTMQRYDRRYWHAALALLENDSLYFWRDGESFLLIPDGLAREEFWLANDNARPYRAFLYELPENELRSPNAGQLDYSPLTSFTPWIREFKMMGFLSRVARLELPALQQASESVLMLWSYLITSDILAAVEKAPPTIMLAHDASQTLSPYTIQRSPRGLEAEEHLYLLESCLLRDETLSFTRLSRSPLLRKTYCRLRSLLALRGKNHAL